MPIPQWWRWVRPRYDKRYNDRYPNHIKHWMKELRIPKRVAMLYLVRFKRTAPDYDIDKHICCETWEMLYHGRSKPSTKTAWKFVQMFEEYAPHQALMPQDIFPVFAPHTNKLNDPNYRGYLPAYREHKTLKMLTDEERAKRKKFIKDRIKGVRRFCQEEKERIGKY